MARRLHRRASMIGTTLLNYRVTAQLGAGGLGTVYAGEHAIIGRKAALKVLNPDVAHDESLVARFLAEARAVNAIRHPNIVDVTDYGQTNGLFVIIMELLDGETLASRLERGPLPERQVLAMLTQTASALGAAHERDIVHRDLKPENLFLTKYPDYPDFVKVLDFGIAKLMDAQPDAKTKPGLIIGTPAYMSPEQCQGEPSLGPKSDVYSLGIVAYRMLSGRLPFEGSFMQLLHAHTTRAPEPLRFVSPDVSPELERVVMACLEKNPAQRPASMLELRQALVALGGRSPIAFRTEELPVSSVAATKPDQTYIATKPGATVPTADVLATLDALEAPPQREDPKERAQAVAVAARMRTIISKRLASDSLKLPSLPEVAVKCIELAHDPEVHFGRMATVIERDPFIASRVVRLSNSPLFGGLARISSIEAAIARLGMKTLLSLLQELAAEQVFASRDPQIRNAFRGIWEHCLGVAHLSRDVAAMVRGIDPNTAYLSGLFHDIGKPVVAALLLEAERSTAQGQQWLSGGVWRLVVDECHRDVGACIAYRWFLPQEVTNAIAQLDAYDLKRGRSSSANVVRLANALCQREGIDVKAQPADEVMRVILQGRQILGLTDEQLSTVVTGLGARVQALTQSGEAESGTRVFDRSVA